MASDSNDNLSTPSTQVARASTAPSSRASSTAPSSAALGISSEEDDNDDDDLEKKDLGLTILITEHVITALESGDQSRMYGITWRG